MKMCKTGADSSCGKLHCCIECSDKDTCPDVCEFISDSKNCPSLYEEDNSLQEFENAVPKAIEIMGDILQKKKELEATEAKMREELIEAMKKYGVKSFKNDLIVITYKAPSTRISIDSAKLKKEHPEIAEQYSKTSSVKESVTIKLKE